MIRLILTTIALLLVMPLTSQDLRTSKNTSYYTYIFRLTSEQADKVYRKNTRVIDKPYYSELIDSFETGRIYQKSLSTGHYLYVHSNNNQIELEVVSLNNIKVIILNNNRDLNVMVVDSSGRNLSNAVVRLKCTTINYNPESETYLLPKTNTNGLLKVTWKGHTSYYNVKADHHYSKFRITSSKILYKSPLKLIAIPVKIIAWVPYDTYRLARYQRFYGAYYFLTKPFCDLTKTIRFGEPTGIIRGITNIFNSRPENLKGYLVFNKPKYLPGDTVFFKAYILNKNLRPIKDSLKVDIYTDKNQTLGWVKPYRPGAYSFQFIASRNLGLKLDRNYQITLGKNYTTYMSGNFKFEEYELKSTSYNFSANKTEYKNIEPVTFYCKGTDENELILPDARVEITMLKKDISEYYSSRVFVPDTLWTHKQNLDPLGETKIIVPDSIFPEAAIIISAEARFLNSNNELQIKSVTFSKEYRQKEIVFDLLNDTLSINYLRNGKSEKTNALFSISGFTEKQVITLPYKCKINPFANYYNVVADSITKMYLLSSQKANVQCFSRRDADSVYFSIDNPRNVPLTYTVFRKNKPIFRGTTNNPEFSCKSTTRDNYFASVQYIWDGQAVNEEYSIPFYDKQLKITYFQPSIIYPGLKTKINIAVTDAYGKPVPNADITAFSNTKKFNTNDAPTLQYLGKKFPERNLFNNFRSNDEFNQLVGSTLLQWKRWNPRFSLDTIERYKFLYPKNGYYQTTFARTDTTFAEVSPFLTDSIGNPMPINIVYIDGNPVYYSITTNQKPYVFRINQGWHSIRIRSSSMEIEIISNYFKNGTKTILCINPYIQNTKYRVRKMPHWYTPQEQNLIRNSVMAVRNYNVPSLSYLQQGINCEILKPGLYNYRYNSCIVGPLMQTNFTYNNLSAYSLNSQFEPNFEYEFLPGLIKMRTWNTLTLKKNYTDTKKPPEYFNDSIQTLEDIHSIWDLMIKNQQSVKPAYKNPHQTNTGNGLLVIDYRLEKTNFDLQAKNILIFSLSNPDFLRIYPGSERTIHDLCPGYYRLEVILYNNQNIVVDSIKIRPHGTNYCKFTDQTRKTQNSYIDSINSIIQYRLFGKPFELKYQLNESEEQKRIIELAKKNRKVTYTNGQILKGKILDATTNEILPGVNIILDGSTQGTATNLDGEFTLDVPSDNYTVSISFIGYKTEKLNLKSGADIRIYLTPDIQCLSEVVVVGYGIQSTRDLTSSVSRVISKSLQGRLAGVSLSQNSSGIIIRGNSPVISNNQALYVIDGIPVIGNAFVKSIMQNKEFMEGLKNSKSLRNQFSDYAFWKPNLTTNSKGLASFEVTFPDDITAWKTYYIAMSPKGTCGQTEGEIKALKPVVSNMAIPRFLIAGDRCNILGKALNYTEDSISVNTHFKLNDSVIYHKEGKILTSRIDTLNLIITGTDSIKLLYQLQRDDGYTDGELRNIPVFPLGTIETKGKFYNLDSDTTIAISYDKSLGKITLHAEADIINILLDDMKELRNYRHLCNEQLSSKLKGMLLERDIYNRMKKEYTFDSDIRKIISMLEDRRNADSLWGWWQNGPTCWWITLHATEALKKAQISGFKTSLNYSLVPPHVYLKFHTMHNRDQMRAVKLLKAIDPVPDYKTLIDSINISKYDTVGRYELWELKQTCGVKFPLDSLMQEQKTTQFGNYYWGSECYSLFDDAISATLVAYRIFRTINPKSRELHKIRNYMLERKNNRHWRNTWETSRILETILPDLISNNEINLKPRLQFTGGISENVDSFPFTKELQPEEVIYVTKKSNAPVYLTAYQQFLNSAPEAVTKDFLVTSRFENNDSTLIAGKPIKLIVDITVKKASEYVMIEIPIPAGCTYQSKNNFVRGEDYREYFKEKVSIYCSRLGQRKYTFEVNLLPRYNGTYHLNPAKAELMYFPVFYGREGMKQIVIE